MKPWAARLGLGALVLAGCATPRPARPPARPSPYEARRAPPVRGPRALDDVVALAVAGDVVLVGTAEGIVRLHPDTGALSLLDGDEHVAHAHVTDLAAGPGGEAWSSHDHDPSAARRTGGVRRLHADGASFDAWFEEDGLGVEGVDCIAVGERLVAACAQSALALLRLDEEPPTWRRELEGPSRPVVVMDPLQGPGATRRVVEFRPPRERVTALAIAGDDVYIGTNEGLLVRRPSGLLRLQLPCRVGRRQPQRVVALAQRPAGGVVAVLGLDAGPDAHRPGGLLEAWPDGEAAWGHACHEPGVDVPDALALDVAATAGAVLLATHAGLTRISGRVSDLLDPLAGAPDAPVTAVAAGPDGVAWVGTWGAGVVRLDGDDWRLFALLDGLSPLAQVTDGRLR